MTEQKKNAIKGTIFLVIAVAFIFIGIYRDEVKTVINKATAICMECIGIG